MGCSVISQWPDSTITQPALPYDRSFIPWNHPRPGYIHRKATYTATPQDQASCLPRLLTKVLCHQRAEAMWIRPYIAFLSLYSTKRTLKIHETHISNRIFSWAENIFLSEPSIHDDSSFPSLLLPAAWPLILPSCMLQCQAKAKIARTHMELPSSWASSLSGWSCSHHPLCAAFPDAAPPEASLPSPAWYSQDFPAQVSFPEKDLSVRDRLAVWVSCWEVWHCLFQNSSTEGFCEAIGTGMLMTVFPETFWNITELNLRRQTNPISEP